jgi:hypothetical protein
LVDLPHFQNLLQNYLLSRCNFCLMLHCLMQSV